MTAMPYGCLMISKTVRFSLRVANRLQIGLCLIVYLMVCLVACLALCLFQYLTLALSIRTERPLASGSGVYATIPYNSEVSR